MSSLEPLAMRSGVNLSAFDSGMATQSYLVAYENRHWCVSEVVYLILLQLPLQTSHEGIQDELMQSHHVRPTEQQINSVIEFVTRNGLAEGYLAADPAPARNRYLWLRITIVPASLVARVRLFTVFFSKRLFIPGSVVGVLWLAYMLLTRPAAAMAEQLQTLPLVQFVQCFLVVLLIGLIHEFGHSSALLRFGQQPGRIGVGVYFIMPVFFSDVTRAWRLKRMQRIMVDAGGMYLQVIGMMAIAFVNAMFFKSGAVDLAVVLAAAEIVANLNPFIKLDGYWLLTDGLGVTNLRRAMADMLLAPFRKHRSRTTANGGLSAGRSAILVIYFLAQCGFLVYFGSMILHSIRVSFTAFWGDAAMLVAGKVSLADLSLHSIGTYVSSRLVSLVVILFVVRMVMSLVKWAAKSVPKAVKALSSRRGEGNSADSHVPSPA